MDTWYAVQDLAPGAAIAFVIALAVAFAFEFINGFHDTANAVTTVIYTRTMRPTPAVIYSGFMNFLGALVTVVGGAGVAFGIVNLLPVDLLVNANSTAALISVLALLLTGVMWNLGTWYFGIPVSSSHTLIGSILGVGLANSLIEHGTVTGVNWDKATQTFFFLFISPVVGFIAAGALLLVMKYCIRDRKLYEPPHGDDKPPGWIRSILIGTCGAVSFAHGSNDGQKGMGLLLLVLIGFLPFHYALDAGSEEKVTALRAVLPELKKLDIPPTKLCPNRAKDIAYLEKHLDGIRTFGELPLTRERWEVRQAIFRLSQCMKDKNFQESLAVAVPDSRERKAMAKALTSPIEYVPLWVVVGTALALGIGTTVGYKRIVLTVAEKIGKTHLTYAQGAAAEAVAALTIAGADLLHAPVSTTQVLSSGVAGTMAANRSGVQMATARRIMLAWLLTLPATTVVAGVLYAFGKWLFAA